jgi:hypothetical protein
MKIVNFILRIRLKTFKVLTKKMKTTQHWKEPPKKTNHKGNIKFMNVLLLQKAHQIRKCEGLLKRRLA